jgi:hypothetical protein
MEVGKGRNLGLPNDTRYGNVNTNHHVIFNAIHLVTKNRHEQGMTSLPRPKIRSAWRVVGLLDQPTRKAGRHGYSRHASKVVQTLARSASRGSDP